jgi:hypothetical protein
MPGIGAGLESPGFAFILSQQSAQSFAARLVGAAAAARIGRERRGREGERQGGADQFQSCHQYLRRLNV